MSTAAECAERLNAAIATREAFWRSILAEANATIAELRTRVLVAETTVAVLTEENEKLRAFAGKDLA